MSSSTPPVTAFFPSIESLNCLAETNAKRIAQLTTELHSSQKELAALRAAAAASAGSRQGSSMRPSSASKKKPQCAVSSIAPAVKSSTPATPAAQHNPVTNAGIRKQVSRKPRPSQSSRRKGGVSAASLSRQKLPLSTTLPGAELTRGDDVIRQNAEKQKISPDADGRSALGTQPDVPDAVATQIQSKILAQADVLARQSSSSIPVLPLEMLRTASVNGSFDNHRQLSSVVKPCEDEFSTSGSGGSTSNATEATHEGKSSACINERGDSHALFSCIELLAQRGVQFPTLNEIVQQNMNFACAKPQLGLIGSSEDNTAFVPFVDVSPLSTEPWHDSRADVVPERWDDRTNTSKDSSREDILSHEVRFEKKAIPELDLGASLSSSSRSPACSAAVPVLPLSPLTPNLQPSLSITGESSIEVHEPALQKSKPLDELLDSFTDIAKQSGNLMADDMQSSFSANCSKNGLLFEREPSPGCVSCSSLSSDGLGLSKDAVRQFDSSFEPFEQHAKISGDTMQVDSLSSFMNSTPFEIPSEPVYESDVCWSGLEDATAFALFSPSKGVNTDAFDAADLFLEHIQ